MALQTKDFSVTVPSASGGITYTYILRVTEESIDTANNSSYITVRAILKQDYAGTAFYSWSTGVSCTLNGQQLFSDYRQRELRGTQEHIYYTWSGEVGHDEDGKLTLSVSGKLWQASPESFSPPTMVIPAGQMVLTPISRVSVFGATDAAIGSKATVVIYSNEGYFTHSLHWAFGELEGYLQADGTVSDREVIFGATSLFFPLPESFYSQIPDSPWDTCRLTLHTYHAEKLIGTYQDGFRVMARKEDCAPILTPQVTDGNPVTLALTGDDQVLIRYHSHAVCTAGAEGQKGAAITEETVNGYPVTGGTRVFENVETGSFLFQARDSRGFETADQRTLPLIPYVRLTCNPTAGRVSPATGEVALTLQGNCFCGNFGIGENSLSGRCRVKPAGGDYGPWQNVDMAPPREGTYQTRLTLTGVDYTRVNTVQTEVKDRLETVVAEVTVQPGVPVFDWGKDYFRFHVPVIFEAGTVAQETAAPGNPSA